MLDILKIAYVGSHDLRNENEMMIPEYIDNNFSKIYWFYYNENDNYEFKKELPYLRLYYTALRYFDVYDNYDERLYSIPMRLSKEIKNDENVNSTFFSIVPELNYVYYIMWSWNGESALKLLLENIYFTNQIIGLKNASMAYFNKNYIELDQAEAIELVIRAVYLEKYYNSGNNFNKLKDELYERYENYKKEKK